MNDIYYSSTEATEKIIMVIAVAIAIITTITAIITTTIRARAPRGERKRRDERETGVEGWDGNFVSRLYLHKIVVPDASEDNEMKLNK